jgi:hypothetical protein
MVFSHSGKRDLKEAYAVKINADGTAVPDDVTIGEVPLALHPQPIKII